jgi:asparagine synthase (glutamine-hydrolysing)
VRDALLSSDRGLFPRELVTAMLDDPNSHRTNLDGSTLWQLGLLELWMQEHVG